MRESALDPSGLSLVRSPGHITRDLDRQPSFPPAQFMSDGFLGYPASFMLDVVVCALIVVVPLLAFNIYVVRFGRNYRLHKRLQLLLAAVLLVAVGLFELDMQWQGGGGWNPREAPSAPLCTRTLQFSFLTLGPSGLRRLDSVSLDRNCVPRLVAICRPPPARTPQQPS